MEENKMKKIFKMLVSTALVITMIMSMMAIVAPKDGMRFGITANAAAVSSGTCGASGSNLKWTLDDSGTLTISGIGKMNDYTVGSYSPWGRDIYKVVIKSGVTSIGDYAFDTCSSLRSISIPGSVSSIGNRAFFFCGDLKSISLPNGVTSIGEYAFCKSGLESINISETVTSIGVLPFQECVFLKSINVDSKNTKFKSSDGVLYNKSMTEIICCPGSRSGSFTIPSSVTSIGVGAFVCCDYLTNIIIPNSATKIGDAAFGGCISLTEINIPNSVKSIGDKVFDCCYSLTSISIPNSVGSISAGMFIDCRSLKSVFIPSSITLIDYSAFTDCYSLKDVYYFGTKSQWNSISIKEYNECIKNANIHYLDTSFNARRLSGTGRIDTAIAISEKGWTKSSNAILAYGMNYADALASAPLAAGLDCPILLTENLKSGLETSVKNELSRLGVKNIYIIGGVYVVSESIANSLGLKYNVSRVAGLSRYETSIEIAKELQKIRTAKGLGSFTNAYFCSAGSFADALAISPVAGIELNPILYAPAKGSSLKQANANMHNFVSNLGTKNTTIIGGIYAVSEDAEKDIKTITGQVPVRVDAGLTGGRYETMLNVCKKYDSVFTNRNAICVATGTNFPDALAGAVFAAKNKCPIILVGYTDTNNTQTSINIDLKNYIKTKTSLSTSYIFGGIYAVPDKQIFTLLDKTVTIAV